MNSSLEGRIDITLRRHGGRIDEVRIVSSRPQVAQRLLAGRTPAEAADLVGMIFTLCGKAQRIAAEAACEAALGMNANTETDQMRQRKVLGEMALEHAWRLLLDWPSRQGVAADPVQLLGLRRVGNDPVALADALDAVLAGPLLGEPAVAWLARFDGVDPLAAFDAWAGARATPLAGLFADLGTGADLGVSRIALLPALDRLDEAAAHILARSALENPEFCARPAWAGAPAETGAIARCHDRQPVAAWLAARGRGVGARMLPRLLELARLPARLRRPDGAVVRAWRIDEATGMAGVETSRGLLLHIVRLDNGKVGQYRIIAPTEWNFHPDGPLAQALSGLTEGAGINAAARQVALSLDPCVDYTLSNGTADHA
jgi:hypothetical protein